MAILRRLLIPSLLAAATVALCADELKMDVRQAFEGYVPQYGTMPVAVDLSNDGPDARGVLRVMSQEFQTDYPIELPQGARKRVFTFPSVNYSEVRYVLLTNRGNVNFAFTPEMKWEGGQQTVVMVSDSPGELAFIRTKSQNNNPNQVGLQDAYVRPGKAPDRPVGYSGIGAVILGSGAERLSNAEAAALRLYCLTGGTLVFLGGASAPILNDPRWAEVLPASKFHPVNRDGSRILESLGASSVPTSTYMTGTPLVPENSQSEGDVLISATRNFGLGRVLYLSFNPFEPPLNHWAGRAAALKKFINISQLNWRKQFLGQFSRENASEYYGYASSTVPMPAVSGSSRYARYYGANTAAEDPFSTKLPPTEKIFVVLALYFLFVVPINFFVLKRLGKAELAWFTAPVISLVFAAILFSQAQGLYSAKLSTASQGLLIVQEGQPEGMFVGSSQVFIPVGGTYDLKFEGVDSVGMIDSSDPYGYPGRSRPTLDLNPVDDGQVRVPELRANNLAFKEITYRQRTPAGDWFQVRSLGGGKYRLTNDSPYTLSAAQLYVGERRLDIPALKGGGSVTVEGAARTSFDDPFSLSKFVQGGRIALSGYVEGFRPGPQIGKEVSARSKIRIAYFFRGSA